MKPLIRSVFAASAIMAIGLSAAPSKAEEANYILATASTGGTIPSASPFPRVKVKLQPTEKIDMSAISSAGSGENIRCRSCGA
jgi:hypothetical protein